MSMALTVIRIVAIYDYNYASHSVPCAGFAMRESWSLPTLFPNGRCKYKPFSIFHDTLNMVKSINCIFSQWDIVRHTLRGIFGRCTRKVIPAMCTHAVTALTNRIIIIIHPLNYRFPHHFILVPKNTKKCWQTPVLASTCMLALLLRFWYSWINDECWQLSISEYFLFVCSVQNDMWCVVSFSFHLLRRP